MKSRLLGTLCVGTLLAMATASYANFNFINHTGENILIQPVKNGYQNCKAHEPIPHPGYFMSLGEYDRSHTILGLGNPGRRCQQAFHVYEAPNTRHFLGTITIYSHDTDGLVDQQVRISKGSRLEGKVSKDGGTVTITR
jgi:hypothetical protein